MAEQKRDYYEVLGVDRNASEAEIKRAYRKLAKENHPDLHPGDKACEARFKEANEAYEVLSNAEKKAKYDQFGFAGVDPNYGAGAGGYGGGFTGDFDFGDLGDIFGSFFGGGFGGGQARRNGPVRGETIRTSVSISFEEAAFGCEKEVVINRTESCSECGGTGKIIHQPCPKCHGTGAERRQRTIKASIPAGIDNGQTISLRGQGNAGKNGGIAGDLHITVTVRPHEIFRREGNSVLCEAPITFVQAALGTEMEIPTIDGKVKYTIPEGTQSGTVFRLKGKGIPNLNGRGRGDQFVTVFVETPRNLTAEQREALKKFGETMGENNYGERKGFFRKFKK